MLEWKVKVKVKQFRHSYECNNELSVFIKCGPSLTSRGPVSFSSGALHLGVKELCNLLVSCLGDHLVFILSLIIAFRGWNRIRYLLIEQQIPVTFIQWSR